MKTEPSTRGSRVAGGYVLIPAAELCAAWAAYRTGRVRLYDFRVWLAAREAAARRCRLGRGRAARYTPDELHRLVGGAGGPHIEAALRRLEVEALLRFRDESLTFGPGREPPYQDEFLSAMLAAVTRSKRRVPVPRRVLRHLARDGGRVAIATIFAHLIRCLFLRGREAVAVGRCAASWVAAVFRVDERRVKAERKRLLAEGWLAAEPDPVWARNRWGLRVRVDLQRASGAAARPAERSPATGLPPRGPRHATGLPPPDSDLKLLPDLKNQKPAARGPAGVHEGGGGSRPPRPTWRAVRPADLRDTGRLLVLLRQAVADGLVPAGEHARLRFVTAAEHARAVGVTNPCGLFVTLVRRGLWHYATQADEDAARARLLSHATGHPPGRPSGGGVTTAAQCLTAVLGRLGLTLPAAGAPRGGHNVPAVS